MINALVLHDAVNTEDFKNLGLTKYLYEFVYVGSLFDGKGIEIIDYLSKNFYEKNFYIFGDVNTLNFKHRHLLKRKNVFFKNNVDYQKIPKILISSKFLLMPYLNSVNVNKNLD